MQNSLCTTKNLNKTLFLREETQKLRVEKENEILCIQGLGKIVLRIVLI